MDTSTGSDVGGPVARGTSTGDDPQGRMWDQEAGVAGLIFIALVVAGFITPATPASDSSPAELAGTLTGELTGHQWSVFLGFLADVAFFVLLVGLWSRLRRYEGPAGMFGALFVVAGTAFTSLVLVSEGLYLALVEAPAAGADLTALPALAVLDDWVGVADLPAGVAMFLGAAGAILSTRAMPVWLGWLAGLTALLLLVSVADVFETRADHTGFLGVLGFASFLLVLVWILAASVVLLLRKGRTPAHLARP
jgi:hypothetical protein